MHILKRYVDVSYINFLHSNTNGVNLFQLSEGPFTV